MITRTIPTGITPGYLPVYEWQKYMNFVGYSLVNIPKNPILGKFHDANWIINNAIQRQKAYIFSFLNQKCKTNCFTFLEQLF